MKFSAGLAMLLVPAVCFAQAAASVTSALLGTGLPDGTSVSANFLYRATARESLKLDAVREGVKLGPRLEVFRLSLSAPPTTEIIASVQRSGWTVTMSARDSTTGIADKDGASSVLLSFVTGKKDRWLYTAEISQRSVTVAAAATPSGPVTAVAAVEPAAAGANVPATPPAVASTPAPVTENAASAETAPGAFAFSTTNFDDGWTSVIGESYTKVTKGDLRVVLHYAREEEKAYMSVLAEQTTLFWNLLVAPRYRDLTDFVVERNNPGGYEPINYAAGTATDIETGRRMYVVLFSHPNRNTHWMEFATPDKATFEREFGPYRQNETAWDRWVAMAGRNRFAVSPRDFVGTWSDNFASGTSMVYAATGRAAGMMYAGGNTTVSFTGASYQMDVASATGMVGSIRSQNVSYRGNFSVVDNWTIAFGNNFQGRTRRFHASFEGIRGGRVLNLVLDEPGAGITLHMVRVR